MKVSFKVRQDLSGWNGYAPGQLIEVENDTDIAAQVAAAENAGMLTDVQYDSDANELRILTVEQDRDSLDKQRVAQQNGSWQEGNVAQFEVSDSQEDEV